MLMFLLCVFLSAGASASPSTFQSRMGSIVSASSGKGEQFGINVVSLSRGDTLYSHNADTPLNPASVTKLITTAAALKLLGPEFAFHTKYYTDAPPSQGRVGTLWVKGYGDPSIVIERLWRVARDIANTGLKEINGNIVIDDTYFEDYKYPGYIETSGRAYNSLTGAVSLNYNTVTVVITPAAYVGGIPYVAPDTAGPYFRITNQAKTSPRGSKNTLAISRKEIDGDDTITVTGNIPIQAGSQYMYGNISNPPLYFGLALKSLLQQNGIKVGGQVVTGRFPGGAYLLLDSTSKPLSQILADMNKYSNNFIAEQIVKTLGAEIGGIAGTTGSGMKVIRNYLSHLGIQPESYNLLNGSGLNKDTKIPASALTKVLQSIYMDFRIAPEAISSFSVAGVDGTTKDRHKDKKLQGLARLKTGSLFGVSTLSGLLPADNGEMIGFAILLNGNSVGWVESHNIQEKMMTAIAAFTR